MLFLLHELGNGLEWVNNTATLISKTSEVYFLLCWASGRHFMNLFVRQPLSRIFWFFGNRLSSARSTQKWIFQDFIGTFPGANVFDKCFSQKVQISKFCLYKLMYWVQVSMSKGFLWGLGTCHTFHNWVTNFSVFACLWLYLIFQHNTKQFMELDLKTEGLWRWKLTAWIGFVIQCYTGSLAHQGDGNSNLWFFMPGRQYVSHLNDLIESSTDLRSLCDVTWIHQGKPTLRTFSGYFTDIFIAFTDFETCSFVFLITGFINHTGYIYCSEVRCSCTTHKIKTITLSHWYNVSDG